MARVVMTADTECKTCKGTGRTKEHRMRPGELTRIGGGQQGYMASVVCHCVRADSPTSIVHSCPELSAYVKRLEESLKLCRAVLLASSHPCAMGCNEGMRATGHSANCQLRKAIESASEALGETP